MNSKVNPHVKLYEETNLEEQIKDAKIVLKEIKSRFNNTQFMICSFDNLEYGDHLIFETDYIIGSSFKVFLQSVKINNIKHEKNMDNILNSLKKQLKDHQINVEITNKDELYYQMDSEKTVIKTFLIKEGTNIASTNYSFDDIKFIYTNQYEIKLIFRVLGVLTSEISSTIFYQLTSIKYRPNRSFQSVMFGENNMKIVQGFARNINGSNEGSIANLQNNLQEFSENSSSSNKEAIINVQNNSENNEYNVVNFLEENGHHLKSKKDKEMALEWAAANGHLNVVKYIFDGGLGINDFKEIQFIFRSACQKGHLDIVKYLLEKGINKTDLELKNNLALRIAAPNGHLHVIKFLLEEYHDPLNIDAIRSKNNYAIQFAAKHGHFDVVKYLYSRGLNLNDLKSDNNLAFRLAAQHGHLEIVKYFVEQGLKLDDFKSKNNFAFRFAALNGHLEIIKYLAGQGLTLDDFKSKDNYAFRHATVNGHLDVVKFLCEAGISKDDFNKTEYFDIAKQASLNGHEEVSKYLVFRFLGVNN